MTFAAVLLSSLVMNASQINWATAQLPDLKCQSIDQTHAPRFTVSASRFDLTFPDSYLIVITRETDLAGPIQETIQGEARMIQSGSSRTLLIVLPSETAELTVWRLKNGVLKGELLIGGEAAVELICSDAKDEK